MVVIRTELKEVVGPAMTDGGTVVDPVGIHSSVPSGTGTGEAVTVTSFAGATGAGLMAQAGGTGPGQKPAVSSQFVMDGKPKPLGKNETIGAETLVSSGNSGFRCCGYNWHISSYP